MKKTFCISAALLSASAAYSLELTDVTKDTYSISCPVNAFTLTLKLNVENFVSALKSADKTSIATISYGSTPSVLITSVATSTSYTNQSAGIIRSTATASTGGTATTENSTGNDVTGYNSIDNQTALANLNANDIYGAALTMTYNYNSGHQSDPTVGALSGCTFVLTLMDKDGNTAVYAEQHRGRKSSYIGSTNPISQLDFNTNLVTAFAYSNSGVTVAEAASLNAAAIPEPATATLSLLALAGLAARRRRK